MPRRTVPVICAQCGASFTNSHNGCKYCSACRTITQTCPVCHKQFTTSRSHPTTTCSGHCSGLHRWRDAEHQRAEHRPRCAQCGGPITRKCMNSGKRTPKHVFCSLVCTGQWQSSHRVGPDHPRWKGGYPPYYAPHWRDQRALVLDRDNHTCQRCGITQQQLDAQLHIHHIRPLLSFGEDYDAANALTNLITYCPSCHSIVENAS
jgi:5-methylcytosine-specific restriction endonuclease McrA